MLASWRRLSARGPRADALVRTASYLCSQPHASSRANPSSPAISQQKYQTPARHSSSSSRWLTRQSRDPYARDAKLQNLKSRAAFKLLELDSRHKLFRRGDAVVDLGYAPGSWAQVAVERTRPNGLVLGIDVIPAAPPRGVSTIQGNFLSEGVRQLARRAVGEMVGQREARRNGAVGAAEGEAADDAVPSVHGKDAKVVAEGRPSYIDIERLVTSAEQAGEASSDDAAATAGEEQPEPVEKERLVDVVLSDMSAPWIQTAGFSKNSLTNPYRMMNTSGISFRDHAGSMDLCMAALSFASDTLRPGGHFVCKFYQGGEDKAFENRLKKLFAKVHREKPDSSRTDSKEAYFVALKRKGNVRLEDLE